MQKLIQTLRLSLRILSTKPLFSVIVIGMLAVGIGSNAALFSMFDTLFLRPLPFAESNQLIDLDETAPQWNLVHVGVSNPDLHQWRTQNTTFESMAFFRRPSCNLSVGSSTERVLAAQVTHEMLDVLRLRPLLGRNFSEEEDQPGGAGVALLSYDLWQRSFHGGRDVLGEVVKLDDQPYTVIGVLPREAVFPDRADLWFPLAPDPNASSGFYLNGIGRLKLGVSIARAHADLLRIHKSMIAQGHTVNRITSPLLMPLRERYLGDFKIVGRVILSAVTVVLLITCVNIAALMMVRGSARAREFAIRAALGASRGRLITQLFAENVALAAIGGTAGGLIGASLLQSATPLIANKLPQWVHFSLDWRFVLLCIAVSCASTLVFGLFPALQHSRVEIRGSLQDVGTRTTPPRSQRTILNAFVVCEISLALLLSISAGLLLLAFRKVMRVDPGFESKNVLTFRVRIPAATYPGSEQKIAYYDRLLSQLEALPGVKSVGAASAPPLGGQWGGVFEAEGGRAFDRNGENPTVMQVAATPGYFRAIGMTLLDGRAFEQRDGEPMARSLVMVNETFAKHFWTSASPIGKHIRRVGGSKWLEVIGVLRDEKHYGLDQQVLPGVFLPYPTALATALPGDERAFDEMSIVLRSSSDPKFLIDPAREILRQVDPEVPMYAVLPMTEVLDQSLWTRKAYSWLFEAFAAVAVLLSAAGIYGTVSYRVSQRTQEIGIRMALGAQRGQVFGNVLLGSMALIWTGVLIGLIGALWATTLLRSLLFGVAPHDPGIYAVTMVGIATIALLATFVPARRAMRVDPMVALRYE